MSDGWIDPIRQWVTVYDEFAPGLVEGLYVVGSAALDDWQPSSSDIDIVAVTTEPADVEMAGSLLTAHAVHAERYPGSRIDGPFVAWGDLVVPPQAVTRPWVLDGSFHHDAECFELNPVTWFTLARHGIRIRGPQPKDVPIPTDLDERIRFVVDSSMSYWRQVHADLRGALGELSTDDTLPSSVPTWCLLGVCRMLYTATTGDVTSKSGAGRWAAQHLDADHAAICREAVAMRAEPERPVGGSVLIATADAMGEVLRRISTFADR